MPIARVHPRLKDAVAHSATIYALAFSLILISSGSPTKAEPTHDPSSDDEKELQKYSVEIKNNPSNIYSYLAKASILWRQGKRDAALEDLASARNIDAYLADATEGSFYHFSGDMRRADKLLTDAISRHPKRFEAYYYRARVSIREKNQQAALDDLASALAYSPQDSHDGCEAALLRGSICFELRRYHEAIQDATQAINRKLAVDVSDAELGVNLNATNPRHYFLRAAAYAELGDYQRAIADYNICETTDVRWPQLYLNRAECHRQLGDLEREKADRKKAQEIQSSQK